MPIDKTENHEKIIAAAWKEFLAYGFADASMRRIAQEVGMSASGLYKHFAGKEEMFSALVEPACRGLVDLFRREAGGQEQAVEAGGAGNWQTAGDATMAVRYIYDHLDAFRLVICGSQGTKYEGFLHDLAVLEEQTTLAFMELLKKQGVKLRDFDEREFHLLVTTNVSAVFQTVEHGLTREKALHYAETLDRFFSRAWQEFFGY